MTGAKESKRRGLTGRVGATEKFTLVVSDGDAESAVMPTSLCYGERIKLAFDAHLFAY